MKKRGKEEGGVELEVRRKMDSLKEKEMREMEIH